MAPPLHFNWSDERPPPRIVLRLSARRPIAIREPADSIDTGPVDRPFNLTVAMRTLCDDIVANSPEFRHVDPSRILFAITRSRNGARHGLQARVTPLRSEGGAATTIQRHRTYRIQQFSMNGQFALYLMTFCLPRFMNRDFFDKLVTVFHELYHLSPQFDGDIRRHEGRYSAHTASQKKYDAYMARLVSDYLSGSPDRGRLGFLRLSFGQLCIRHGSIVGLHLPRPKLILIGPMPRPGFAAVPSPTDIAE